jgi:hypothetical protein
MTTLLNITAALCFFWSLGAAFAGKRWWNAPMLLGFVLLLWSYTMTNPIP